MLRRTALLILAAASTACAQLPRAEFQAYRDSFQAAESAAEPMIADYAAAERAVRLRNLQNTKGRNFSAETPYFDSFAPATDPAAVSSIGLPPSARAVNRAFRAISAYNDTLVALAENRNVEEARGQIRQIISDVGGIVPGGEAATAVTAAVSDVVTRVLEPLVIADNRREFRRIVLEGHEPMTTLIDALIRHSTVQYEATVRPYVLQLQSGQGDRAVLIEKVNTWHRAFGDYVVLLIAVKEQFGILRGAILNPRSAPLLARAAAGAAELRSHADALRRSIAALRTLS